jgi:hypothetical protein
LREVKYEGHDFVCWENIEVADILQVSHHQDHVAWHLQIQAELSHYDLLGVDH